MKNIENKEIRKIKLTLTTICNLSCAYCFVEKTKERMSFLVAKKSVDFLLNSQGKEKLLSMYGGEPMLEFVLIKKIVKYANKKSIDLNKNLTISVCTNLSILKPEHALFFKKYNIKITVSLVGPEKEHDKYRLYNRTKNNGTHKDVISNLKKLSNETSLKNIGISYCIFPSTCDKIFENFKYIESLGFYNVNFEIIQNFEKWGEKERKFFSNEFKKILLLLIKKIEKNEFFYINSVNWEIVSGKLTENKDVNCQMKYNLEVYPNGDLAFSPFLFNIKNKNDYIIGNIVTGINDRFNGCVFDKKNPQCFNCKNDYYNSYKENEGIYKIFAIYESMSLEFVKSIKERSRKSVFFKKYIQESRKYLGF